MLQTLRIKNLALVEDLTLNLQSGYIAITGETGAGKSILIGALSLVLGERASKGLIRTGADSCTVEAAFETSKLKPAFAEFLETNGLEPCEDHLLLLKRTFTAAGSNRQFVNGSPTTLNILAAIGEWLVDMHGPHDHQSLLHPARQLAILDAFAGLEKDVAGFGQLMHERAALKSQKSDLIINEQAYAQQLDLLRFQVSEIQQARLQPNEDVEVESEHQRASNASDLVQTSQNALSALDDDEESSLSGQLAALGRHLHDLRKMDESAGELVASHEQIVELVRELQTELSRYADGVDVDPERLVELEQRLALIHSLKRKYGSTLADVVAFGADAGQKLQSLESRDAELDRINTALDRLAVQIKQSGKSLTDKRRKVIPKLAKATVTELSVLGFRQSLFEIAATRSTEPAATGFDQIEFQFAPNPGEMARPLRAIASSGEMSRVMLALKTVLAAEDEIPVLVFDEIDANVGGETAHAVGDKMKQIARNRQVLCITHLPQVAAAADVHFVVSKTVADGRTISHIEQLDRTARVDEISRMLGGANATVRRHAEELIKS